MIKLLYAVLVGIAAVTLAGCNAEEQTKLDASACSGYGFRPGTNEFASCMMQTEHNRDAQQAANQRQDTLNKTIADQAQQDRDAKAKAADQAADAAHQAEVSRLMNSPNPSLIPDAPTIATPNVDTSNMHCTGSQGANAGSMSCTSN